MERPFVTFTDIISEPERMELRDYAHRLLAVRKPEETMTKQDNYGGFLKRVWNTPLATSLIHDLAARLERKFGLAGLPVDPDIGWAIFVVVHGGYVSKHKDTRSYQDGRFKHLRFNVVVAKPEQGGMAVIGKDVLPLVERGGWGFFASETEHSAFPISGPQPRITYTFGYCVPEEWSLREVEPAA